MENNDVIGVSIICTAYNHERYIEKCLDGFLMQETNFGFEVLVHDDASTDQTAEIIRRYEKKAPHIIKPIYQTVNQYSQGIKITSDIIFPMAKGKYIALCEGDDFWTDPRKLQKQYDALEAHPDCNMCICKTMVVHEDGSDTSEEMPKGSMASGVINGRDFLNESVYNPAQTSSFFMRTSVLKDYFSENPEFRRICKVGDFPYRLYFGSHGNVYYLPETMTCYRTGSTSSVSKAMENATQRRVAQSQNMLDTVNAFNEYTGNAYSDICDRWIRRYEFMIHCWKGEYRNVLSNRYKDVFQHISKKRKIDIILSICFPHIYPRLKKSRGLY